MNLLALATSGSECSVALHVDGQTFVRRETTAQQHSRHILHMIDSVFADSGSDPAQLQGLVWDAGPGSFTGLRIGASVCQALASSLALPVLSLSSLELQAFAVMQQLQQTGDQHLSGEQHHIAVALDARMNGIYWATFIASQSNVLRKEDDQLLSLDALFDGRMGQDIHWLVVGDGWSEWLRACELDELPHHIQLADVPVAGAETLLALALLKPEADWLLDASACSPRYLRDATQWKKRERIAG
jgi:tRNA threonylcarbamoyladenosine biosynthesis protein TsaB